MMYAAMLAGIAFNAAGCHLPHGLSYAVSGLAREVPCVRAIPRHKSLVPHGMAVVLNNPAVWRYTAACIPSAIVHGAACLGGETRDVRPGDAAEAGRGSGGAGDRPDARGGHAQRPGGARLRQPATSMRSSPVRSRNGG